MKSMKEGDSPNVDEYLPLIFGTLEGSSGLVDPMLILTERFGQGVESLKIEEMIKERVKAVNYGIDKRKGTSIMELDKKALESLTGLYNIQ